MGNDKDVQKERPEIQPGSRKNNEEVGEPVQLNDDKSQKPGQQNKPGTGPREGEKPGQHQGGGQPQETNR